MKANEAPEKLYILFNHPYTVDYTKLNKRRYDEEVEYTRTDAFVKKTEEFLYEKLNNGDMECGDIIAFINDFRNYMKGE